MKRRDFLQRASWILGGLGISGNEWLQLGNRYYQAIAQPSVRKLALLVGINQYSHQALTGCITDVELQRQLLIHRFGFQPLDILTLSDRQASRQQIETAFLEHLTGQAQPGDLVVFHFSGYGRRVQLETASTALNSLVPVDSIVLTSGLPVVNDLLEETLWLLLRSLATNRVITILDTSYSAASDLQGNLRVRARPLVQGQLSIQAQDFQAQLLERQGKLNLVQPLPGVVLTAAGASQVATEAQWSGFSAGLFTYALTQFLWEATKATTIQVILSRVTEAVEQLGGRQQPVMQDDHTQQSQLGDYLMPETIIGADGVVIAVGDDGKTAQLWLAGLPLPVLEYYAANSILIVTPTSTVDSSENRHLNESSVQLQVRSRTGLTAKAQISSNEGTGSLQVGQRVRESVRVLPRNINLTIALDTGLERIERVDATSAFAAIPHVSSTIAGEQSADYLFGRVQDATSTSSRYGLFSLSQELIPNTTGEPGEAVKVAIQRLAPKLQTLLAAKLWRLTINKTSSSLQVRAAIETITANEQILIQQQTWHESNDVLKAKVAEGSIPMVAIGSRIQYRVHNNSSFPIYLVLLNLDSNKNAVALYPIASSNEAATSEPALKQLAIAPGDTLTVPQSEISWIVRGPTGVTQTQLIFSCASFSQTMVALDAAMRYQEQILPILNPIEVAQAVLQDLHQASAANDSTTTSVDTYRLDVNAWASLSFIYQVV